MINDEHWDDYFYDNSNVLINCANISDANELKIFEQESVLTRLTMLHIEPLISNCDYNNLQNIHKFLFSDVYPFAGQTRKCTLSKNGYNFTNPDEIENDIMSVIEKYSNQIDSVNSIGEYAFVLAPFYYDLIRVHPFREGNGRSIREFLRETVLFKNNVLPFKAELNYEKMDKDLLFKGVQERYFYPSLLETEFMKCLTPIEKEKLK